MTEEYIKLDDAIKQVRDPAERMNLKILKGQWLDLDAIKTQLETLVNVQEELRKANATITELKNINAEFAWSNGEAEKMAEELKILKNSNANLKRENEKLRTENDIMHDVLKDTLRDFMDVIAEAKYD